MMAHLVKNPPAMQEMTCSARDLGSIPGSGRSPGEGNGNPLQYSCLGNLMDRGAWWATLHGVTKVRHDSAKPPHQQQHIRSPCVLCCNVWNFPWLSRTPDASLPLCLSSCLQGPKCFTQPPTHFHCCSQKAKNTVGQNQAIF